MQALTAPEPATPALTSGWQAVELCRIDPTGVIHSARESRLFADFQQAEAYARTNFGPDSGRNYYIASR